MKLILSAPPAKSDNMDEFIKQLDILRLIAQYDSPHSINFLASVAK